jgi:hypothetical protein
MASQGSTAGDRSTPSPPPLLPISQGDPSMEITPREFFESLQRAGRVPARPSSRRRDFPPGLLVNRTEYLEPIQGTGLIPVPRSPRPPSQPVSHSVPTIPIYPGEVFASLRAVRSEAASRLGSREEYTLQTLAAAGRNRSLLQLRRDYLSPANRQRGSPSEEARNRRLEQLGRHGERLQTLASTIRDLHLLVSRTNSLWMQDEKKLIRMQIEATNTVKLAPKLNETELIQKLVCNEQGQFRVIRLTLHRSSNSYNMTAM